MKTILKYLPVAAAFLFFTACTKPEKKAGETDVSRANETVTSARTETPEEAAVINSISGVVTEIQLGKDGYTAKVQTTKMENVYVTVSRANLQDPASYRSAEIGDTLRVLGEQWEMNGRTYLTARQLK